MLIAHKKKKKKKRLLIAQIKIKRGSQLPKQKSKEVVNCPVKNQKRLLSAHIYTSTWEKICALAVLKSSQENARAFNAQYVASGSTSSVPVCLMTYLTFWISSFRLQAWPTGPAGPAQCMPRE